MILDKQTLFSEDQAVTVTAASTNVIDLGARSTDSDLGKGDIKELEIFAQVTTDFAGGTSMSVTVQSDSTAAFSSATTVSATAAVAAATLTAGYQFSLGTVPVNEERFIRLYYTVVGTMSAGNVLAGLVIDRQTNV